MSWPGTVFIAVLTAAVGCVVSGYVASLAVRWYSISSFEGGSGYFVLGMGVLGLIAGFIIGLVMARVVGSSANPGFVKALGYSVGTVLALLAIIGSVARLRADVPPTIDGEPLMVMVEARWPENETRPPAIIPGISSVKLGSVSGHVQRNSEKGALWKEDAKLVDGRWVVPGAVFLFTERGDRVLDFSLNDSTNVGFLTRLPRRPGKEFLEWSEWYPKEGRSGPTRATGVTFRYRVQKVSEPIRVEKLGGFEVSIIARSFQHDIADGTTTLDPYATFRIQYHGKPLPLATTNGQPYKVGMVAQLESATPAMLAYVEPADGEGSCVLLVDEGAKVREQRLSACYNGLQVEVVTNDDARIAAEKTRKAAHGRIDRHAYAGSRFLLTLGGILDTHTLAFHGLSAETQTLHIPSVPPLGIAPDEQSFVRYALANNSDDYPVLVVRNFMRDTLYELPIDKERMPFESLDTLTPEWVMRYFEWTRSNDGTDILRERASARSRPDE